MDLSFDIKNAEGDHLMVALSYYDTDAIKIFSSDPLILTLVFYDVTLVRKSGHGYVGYKVSHAVSDTLARFMEENDNAVLCFYCDATSEVRRNHNKMQPQEYRSLLFTRMFDSYSRTNKCSNFVNHRVMIEDSENPQNRQFAHFICRKEHRDAVMALGNLLMEK